MPVKKDLITSAFEKLGPEKVARGLRAKASADDFDACFVALAYGVAGALVGCRSLHEAMGLTEPEFDALWNAWDDDGRAFRRLAHEWLEAPRVRKARETAVAVG